MGAREVGSYSRGTMLPAGTERVQKAANFLDFGHHLRKSRFRFWPLGFPMKQNIKQGPATEFYCHRGPTRAPARRRRLLLFKTGIEIGFGSKCCWPLNA